MIDNLGWNDLFSLGLIALLGIFLSLEIFAILTRPNPKKGPALIMSILTGGLGRLRTCVRNYTVLCPAPPLCLPAPIQA